MAKPKCNQTRPKFQYRFLALSATDSNVIHIIAPTEREAREQSPMACVLVFAGRLPLQGVMEMITPSTCVSEIEMVQEVRYA
ncbi:host cell division inhibitor Icd-like protein [Serratia marcescens]|nr:host cell division inhibitor Icd-like protein [Serratia marcescens]ULH10627.1 host cell division inhibitor Icd-like protein [Serratia marcescens]